jgi:NAD(P)-dependent dehydrogenase (short-subunit alcohol dehydrogenase family)
VRFDVLINLQGRRIIVAGGASGAGEAAVDGYLEAGARVVSLDINEGPKDAGRPIDRFRALRCDVSQREQVDTCFSQAVEFLGGGLDALCNPAGITGRLLAEQIGEADMRRIFEINVLGTMLTNQAAFRYMQATGGSIINFTSISGIRGQAMRAHYCATKGAVAAWTRAVAIDWAKYNIRVNAIAPMIYTPIVDKVRAALPESERAAFEKSIGSTQRLPGGLRPPSSLIGMMALLASDGGADYMTGQVISLDGGVLMMGS